MEPALNAVYWGIVATRVASSPAGRTEAAKIVDILIKVAPTLRADAEGLLTAKRVPAE